MYFADEVLKPGRDIKGLPVEAEFSDRELAAAGLLIESMAAPWEPERYSDTYRHQVEELVEAKRQGQEVVTESRPEEPSRVVNLLDALNASVRQAQSRPDAAPARPAKRAPATTKGPRKAVAAAKPKEVPAASSRSELYERAASLGVAGRSKMTRAELERAVKQAESATRRKAS
jgi:DNA end-binding protein Ku